MDTVSVIVNGIQLLLWAFALWAWLSKTIDSSTSRSRAAVLGLALISTGLSLFASYKSKYKYVYRPTSNAELELVHDKTFSNERVALDGKSFQHCEFINVTLEFDGTGDFQLSNNNWFGTRKFTTANGAVLNAWALESVFPDDFVVLDANGHRNPRIQKAVMLQELPTPTHH